MIRILFLAANPDNADTLQAGDELRQIEAVLKNTRFQVIAKPAAHLGDLRGLLREYKPQIVHFSGHGSQYGELLLVDDQGQSQSASAQALANLFKLFRSHLRCVILNACYTDTQAAAIGAEIDCVLGFEGAIRDDAARAFAAGFYSALAAGETVALAKEHGLNEIELRFPDALQPCQISGHGDPMALRPFDWDDEAPPAPAPRAPRGIFGLYPFNEHFFGRDDELTELHSLLQAQTLVSICPVITGMGGLGKTQLAAHYARGHVDDYPDGIFWITAANLNEIRPQLADFCVALGLPVADPQRSGDLTEQKITAFKHYLDQHPRTLLIFDNVDEPDHLRTRQLSGHWTALTLGGKVIITTRRRKLASDRFAELALQRLLPAPARQILTTARGDLAHDPDLDRLCDQFGYLPLMLNLAAAALKKRGGAIAGYLQRLHMLGAEKLHSEVAKVSLDDYHHSLTAVLHEQWAMLRDDNARLLLRVAGQLPEAAVIPTARLGLLAGLADVDAWERPLSDALEELEAASLVERTDAASVRLHPLVRDFAEGLTPTSERSIFRTACAQRLADAYALDETGLRRLGHEYAARGIAALLLDLITALNLLRLSDDTDSQFAGTHWERNSQFAVNLQNLLRLLRREANHLHKPSASWEPQRLWQQLLPRTGLTTNSDLTQSLSNLLRPTVYWLPCWGHQRQSSTLEQTLTGHEKWVNGVAVVDGQRIVSASDDHTLKVWNLTTGQVEQTLTGHQGRVNGVAVMDGQRIVSASWDGTLKVWNLTTGQVEQTLTGHQGGVKAVAVVDPQRIVSASWDRTLKLWNLTTGQVEQTLTGHEGEVKAVAVVDGQRIVSASNDRTLKVWNLTTGQVEQTLTGHQGRVNGVAVVDPQQVVSASHDGTLKVWNLATGQLEQTLTGHEGGINDVAVIDHQRVVSASSDRTLKIWNLATGEVEQTFTGHGAWVDVVAVVDSQRIVSASLDDTLKVWNLSTGQDSPQSASRSVEQTLIGHENWVNAVAVADSQRIISASHDQTLKVWNLQTGRLKQTFTVHERGVKAMAVIDPQHIILASHDTRSKSGISPLAGWSKYSPATKVRLTRWRW